LTVKICPACKNEFAGGEVFCPNDATRLETPSQFQMPKPEGGDPLVGLTIDDRYRIIRRIGEGGMGFVYEAEHTALEKRVALKILRDDFSSRSEVVERFRQEAKSASRIGNAHIVDISDFGEMPNGASYFVMELLSGEDLANALAKEPILPLARAADVILQCCRALSAAHAKGIVHRDMKPENIFLTERDGRVDFVKIVDFGIAKMSDIETPGVPGRKLTKTGMIFGTPEYMSPEQAAGKSDLDHRVDVYALGVIFFEMLAGKVPFVGDTFMGILTQHMFEPIPELADVNPSYSENPAIESFIMKALAKAPEDRFESCDVMARALEGALDGQSVRIDPTSKQTLYGHGEPVKAKARNARTIGAAATQMDLSPPRSNAGPWIAGVVALLLAAGIVGYLAFTSQTVDPDPLVADTLDAGMLVIAAAEPDVGPAEGSEPDAGTPDAGPARVSIRMETNPEGARVWIVDHGDVCTETPCTFELPAGQEVTIRAARGRARGEVTLTPSEGMAPISLRLVARPPTGGGDGEPGGGGTGGTGGGDLKIPDIFSHPR